MITIHDTPFEFNPSHNKQVFTFSSTTEGTDGFEFIIDLYNSETDELVSRNYRPRWPNSSFAAYSPHGQLKNLVLREEDITSVSEPYYLAPNSYFKYKLKIGERYNSWTYDDYYFGASGGTIFSSNTVPHNFTVGSTIIINHDSTTTYPQFSGRFSVIGVPDQYSIETSAAFQSGPSIGGTVRYSDGSFVEVYDIAQTSGYTAYAAAFDEDAYINYDEDTYIYATTNIALDMLTMAPDNHKIDINGSFYVYAPSFSGNCNGFFLQTYRANGDIVGTYRITFSGITGIQPSYLGVGPKQINEAGGAAITNISGLVTSTPITDDVDSYVFYLSSTSGSFFSTTKRFYVTRECTKFGQMHLLFQDRLGSWGSFNFNLRRRTNISTKKSLYTKATGTLNTTTGIWEEQTYDYGLTSYDIASNEELTLRIELFTEDECNYFKELLLSNRVYLLDGDDSISRVYIQDGSYQIFDDNDNEKLYEIRIAKSKKTNTLT